MEFAFYLDNTKPELIQTKGTFAKNKKISRIYFGEEFCEELIPILPAVQKSIDFAVKNGLNYTYITGYLSETAIKKQYKILKYLNRQVSDIGKVEVVINDWGVLSLISEEFNNLTPILGRLLTKFQRMPRYTLKQPISFSQLVVNRRLWVSQKEVLRSSNLSMSEYRKFLKREGVKRVELDISPQGIEVDRKWGFKFSVYTPWSYVTGSRTCDLAGLAQPEKARFVTDEPCRKPCKKSFIKFETNNEMLPLVQRGNSIFFNNSSLVQGFVKQGTVDRTIFWFIDGT